MENVERELGLEGHAISTYVMDLSQGTHGKNTLLKAVTELAAAAGFTESSVASGASYRDRGWGAGGRLGNMTYFLGLGAGIGARGVVLPVSARSTCSSCTGNTMSTFREGLHSVEWL